MAGLATKISHWLLRFRDPEAVVGLRGSGVRSHEEALHVVFGSAADSAPLPTEHPTEALGGGR